MVLRTGYEVHASARSADPDKIRRFAIDSGGSVLDLDLDGAGTATQVTWWLSGSYLEAARRLHPLADAAGRAGIKIGRYKIEAERSSPYAVDEPEIRYLELHVLAEVELEQMDGLRSLAGLHGARLSSRARDVRDGKQLRFVNLRVAPPEAHRFMALRHALAGAGYRAVKVHDERVLLDTRPGEDAGWLAIPVSEVGGPA